MCTRYSVVQKAKSNEQSGSVIFRAVVKLSAAHAFNLIILRVKFGLTISEELPPALHYNHFIISYHCYSGMHVHDSKFVVPLVSFLPALVCYSLRTSGL